MAKQSGIGATLAIDDDAGNAQTITNDVTSFSYTMPKALQDVTGLDKAAMERIQLLGDYTATVSGVFNDATNASHDVFKTVQSSANSRTSTFTVSGQQLLAEVLFSDYSLNRGADGSLTFSAPCSLSNGTAPVWSTP